MKINRQFTLVLLGCVFAFALVTIGISYQVLGRMQEAAALNFLETTSRFAKTMMDDQTHEFEAVGVALLSALSEGDAASNSDEAPSEANGNKPTTTNTEGEGAADATRDANAEAGATGTITVSGNAASDSAPLILDELQVILPHLSFALVTDEQGRIISATEGVNPQAGAAFDRFYQQLDQNKSLFIGSMDTFSTETLFEPNSALASQARVTSNDGDALNKVLLNLAVVTDENRSRFLVLGEVVNNNLRYPAQYSQEVSESFLSYVVDNHRIATNLSTDAVGATQLGTPTPTDVTQLPDGGLLGKELSPAGYYYYYLYTPITNYWGEPIAAKAVGIREAVYSSLIHNNIWAIVMVTLAVIPVLALVGRLSSLRITRPLKASKRMAEAIMANNFEAVEHFPVPENPVNETDQLAASLQRMAVSLGESQRRVSDYTEKLRQSERSANELSQQLMKANENLEATVDSRTLELRQLVEELSISNSTKTRFIANISHELKTPLTSSISAADLLLDEIFGSLNEKQVQYLTTIKCSSDHLLQLINDILTVAKIDEGRSQLNRETLPVQGVVSEVVSIILGTFPQRTGDISLQIDPPDLQVTADAAALRQILFNLLTNAVKFSEEGSRITIHAQATTIADKPVVQFAVEDEGIGIAEEDFERVFYEFEQVDNSYSRTYEGTGLGLPIARRQTELHNGKLWLESTLGKGTVIRFFLPNNPGPNAQ